MNIKFLSLTTILCIIILTGCQNQNASLGVQSLVPSSVPTLADAEKPLFGMGANEGSIEMEIKDAKSEKYTLTYADLFYRFYYKAQASGVLAFNWEHPSEINAHYLVNFFEAQANWNQTVYDSEIVHLPQDIVEDYIKMYFDVESKQIRQSEMRYLPDLESYELPMYSLERPCKITNAMSEGNLLTIYYETYNDFKEDLPVFTQGYVTIEIERYPILWKYLSNTITFQADP